MKLISLAGGLLALLLSCGVAQAKEVVIEYQDFLKMLAMKDHSDKTANKYAAENAVLVKLKDEQSTVIQLQKENIQACRDIVKSHEQLGETESQISTAVEAELRARIAELERREKWAVGSGIGIGAGTVAIILAVMWVLN